MNSQSILPRWRQHNFATSVLVQGLVCMILACVFSTLMSSLFYLAFTGEPQLSSRTGSFLRVIANCAFLFVLTQKKGNVRKLLGTKEWSLWLWGFFGSVTVLSFYEGIARSGVGIAALFQGLSAIVLVVFSPWILKQKNSLLSWLALLGSLCGFLLMKWDGNTGNHNAGIGYSVLSGVSAGFAYLMSAKASQKNPAEVIMFYWCIFCLVSHLCLFTALPFQLPQLPLTWILLIVASFLASASQYFTTLAYALAPATPVASVSYLTPVLGLIVDFSFLGIHHSSKALAGAALIILFRLWIPFASKKQA